MTSGSEDLGRRDNARPGVATSQPYVPIHPSRVSLVAAETATVPPAESDPYTTSYRLLHHRLRLLCILGFGGWSLFGAVLFGALDPVFRLDVVGPVCAAIFIVVTVAPLLSGTLLFVRPVLSDWWLRGIELHLLLLCAATLAGFRYSTVDYCLATVGASAEGIPVGPLYASSLNNLLLLCVVVVFGVVVPNRWQRTLAGVTVLTVPSLLAEVCARFLPLSGGNASLPSAAIMTALTVFIGGGVTVFGSYRISRLQSQVSAAQQLLRELGPYKLVSRLGKGGMGEVYLAEHRLLKRQCAVKLIRPEKAADDTFIRRFEREVRAVTRLAHPAAVQVYDYGREADGTFYYVMEYLPGLTLEEVVKRTGPLPSGRVVQILRQVCGALAEAHALGLVHRDVKPGNVMLCRLGGRADAVKLLDFGLVTDTAAPDTRLTQAGGIIGTPAYMSPEAARGAGDLGPASDMYSLGVVAYFLLTGRPPFDSTNHLEVLHAHISSSITPPSTYTAVSADLEAVVLRLLAKPPADRYTAVTADEALVGCDCGNWTVAKATEWWERVPPTVQETVKPN